MLKGLLGVTSRDPKFVECLIHNGIVSLSMIKNEISSKKCNVFNCSCWIKVT